MELWKTHPDFMNYEFSNFGNFRNTQTGQILKKSICERGYVATQLYSQSKKKRIRVKLHRIVGELFLPKSENPKRNHINHIDGVKTNNHYSNLEWVTNEENIQHSIDTGLRKRSWAQKLNEEQVREIRELYNETNLSVSDLAKQFNINESSITFVLKYKSYPNIDPEKKYDYKINQVDNADFFKTKTKRTYITQKKS